MKHKTWFRLVLKVIGVFFTATSLSFFIMSALFAATQNARFRIVMSGQGWSFSEFVHEFATSPVTMIGLSFLPIGLYLFFGGEWIIERAIPTNRPYCPSCGYDLSKRTGKTCPECGVVLPDNVRADAGESDSDA